MFFLTVFMLALTRAEIIERMRAPVMTQAEGLVQVYADCPEDMRREFQGPIASFAADSVNCVYRGLRMRPRRFRKPGVIIHVGDVRTNRVEVFSRVATNNSGIVSRIYVKSPSRTDLEELRLEIVKGFFRSVFTNEVSTAEARRAYRRGNPALRVADERQELEDWLVGKPGAIADEEALKRMRRVTEPGFASKRDILIFASRLFLNAPSMDMKLAGKFQALAFAPAIKYAKIDPFIRLVALSKVNELQVFGGGKGEELSAAAQEYGEFLKELALYKKSEGELMDILENADMKLALAWEKAK